MNYFKMRIFLAIALGFLFVVKATAQDIEWAKTVSGNGYEIGVKSDIDEDGNVYSVGWSTETIQIDTTIISSTPNGDAFVAKHDKNGNLIWIRPFGADNTAYHDATYDVHVDDNGDCYIATVVLGSNFHFNNVIVSGFYAGGLGEGALLKLDSDGNLLWFEHENVEVFAGMDTDNDGNIYLTGYYYNGGSIGGQSLPNPNTLYSSGILLAKLSSSGSLSWVKTVGGYLNRGVDVVVNATGDSIFTTGNLGVSANFDTDTLIPLSVRAVYLAKYDTAGNEIWVKGLESLNYRFVRSMDISPMGNIGIAGHHTLGNTNGSSFVSIYDLNGNSVNTVNAHSTELSNIYGIAFNSDDGYYVSGYFQDDLDVGDTIYHVAGHNNFILKFDSAHHVKWAKFLPNMDKRPSSLDNQNNKIIFTARIDFPFHFNQDSIIPWFGDALVLKLADNDLFTQLDTIKVCEGDSALIFGTYRKNEGNYYDTLQNAIAEDSLIMQVLSFYERPVVSILPFDPDTVCVNGPPMALPNATPAGGTYSGPSIVTGNFEPFAAGLGTHNISYTFNDTNACYTVSDTTTIVVQICVGVDEQMDELEISIYPNPHAGLVTIANSGKRKGPVEIKLVDVTGNLLMKKTMAGGQQKTVLDFSSHSNGIYFLHIGIGNKVMVKQLVKSK